MPPLGAHHHVDQTAYWGPGTSLRNQSRVMSMGAIASLKSLLPAEGRGSLDLLAMADIRRDWRLFMDHLFLTTLLTEGQVPIKLSSHIFEADGDAPFAFSSFHIPASKLPFPSSTIGNWLWFHVRTHWSCQCLPSRLSLVTIPFIILFPCLISDMSTDLLFSCAQYQSVEPS